MFRIDLEAIQEAAIEARLLASLANAASHKQDEGRPLAEFAISQRSDTSIDPAVADLLEAAMRVCDAWGDTADAREQMCRDCLGTPPHLRADLLDHLNSRSSASAVLALRRQRF